MNIGFIYLRRLLKNIDTNVSSISTGAAGNPTGGTVEVSSMNYRTALLMQWMALELGSDSAAIMNLFSSILEPFNLYASTMFCLGQSAVNFAINDVTYALQTKTATILAGFVNPAHLRLSAHFQGTGAVPNSVVAADAPVYNSDTTTIAKLSFSNSGTVTAPQGLASGTPAASSEAAGQPVTNVFDGNAATYWSPLAANYVPCAGGSPSATSNDGVQVPANAFDSNAATYWGNAIQSLPYAGGTPTGSTANGTQTVAKAFDGDSATYFESGAGASKLTGGSISASSTFDQSGGPSAWQAAYAVDGNTSSQWKSMEYLYFPHLLKYDLGSGLGIVAHAYSILAADAFMDTPKTWTFQGSNDDSNWTTLDTRTNITNWAVGVTQYFTFTNSTNYRYYRLNITVCNHANGYAAIKEWRIYDPVSVQNVYLKYDMGSGVSIVPATYSIAATANGPKSWVVEGSNDDSNWDELEAVTDYAGSFPYAGTISTETAYRYFRLRVTDTLDTTQAMVRVYGFSVNPGYITSNPQSLIYDMGAGVTQIAQQYTLNASTYLPKDWTFDGSNNGTDWTTIETVSAYASTFPVTRTVTNAVAYRYYRVRFTLANLDNNYVKISEFSIPPVISATTPAYVSYDLGSGILRLIQQYTINAVTYLPKNWIFQGSVNGTDWTDLDTVIGYVSTFPYSRTFANTTLYRYFRFYITVSTGNSNYVYLRELTASATPVATQYDTVNKVFGSSSAKLMYYYQKGTAVQNINHLKLSNNDWRFSGFFRPQSGFPLVVQTLFSILGKQLEIQMTSAGLRVNYSTDGSNYITVNSSAYTFNQDSWYWVAVGRTGNTLYFSAGPAGGAVTALGTADLTGVTLFPTASNNFYLGADAAGANPFIGNVQEVELFVGENPTHTMPVAARSTAHIPAVTWVSETSFIPSSQTTLGVLFFLDETTYLASGLPVVNSDLVLSVSLDNGATYHTVTLIKDGALTNRTRIYYANVALAGFTNTNQFKYRITSVAGKVAKFDGSIFYWN